MSEAGGPPDPSVGLFFFNYGTHTHNIKFPILTVSEYTVQQCYIHIAMQEISRTFPSHKTEFYA